MRGGRDGIGLSSVLNPPTLFRGGLFALDSGNLKWAQKLWKRVVKAGVSFHRQSKDLKA